MGRDLLLTGLTSEGEKPLLYLVVGRPKSCEVLEGRHDFFEVRRKGTRNHEWREVVEGDGSRPTYLSERKMGISTGERGKGLR